MTDAPAPLPAMGHRIADGLRWQRPDGSSGWVDLDALTSHIISHIKNLPLTARFVSLKDSRDGKRFRVSVDAMFDSIGKVIRERMAELDRKIAELDTAPAFDAISVLARARVREIEAALLAFENDVAPDEEDARAACDERYHRPLCAALGEYHYAQSLTAFLDIRHADGSALLRHSKANRPDALRMLLLRTAETICGPIEGAIAAHNGYESADGIEAPGEALTLVRRACVHRFRALGLQGDRTWGDASALGVYGLLNEVNALAHDPGEVQQVQVKIRAAASKLLRIADDMDREAKSLIAAFACVRSAHLAKSDDGLPAADDPAIAPYFAEAKEAHAEGEPYFLARLRERVTKRARSGNGGWSLCVQKGRQGERGAKGERGLRGERGDRGLPGNKGERGDKGEFIEARITGNDLVIVCGDGSMLRAPLYDLIGNVANIAVAEVERRLPALIGKAKQ